MILIWNQGGTEYLLLLILEEWLLETKLDQWISHWLKKIVQCKGLHQVTTSKTKITSQIKKIFNLGKVTKITFLQVLKETKLDCNILIKELTKKPRLKVRNYKRNREGSQVCIQIGNSQMEVMVLILQRLLLKQSK